MNDLQDNYTITFEVNGATNIAQWDEVPLGMLPEVDEVLDILLDTYNEGVRQIWLTGVMPGITLGILTRKDVVDQVGLLDRFDQEEGRTPVRVKCVNRDGEALYDMTMNLGAMIVNGKRAASLKINDLLTQAVRVHAGDDDTAYGEVGRIHGDVLNSMSKEDLSTLAVITFSCNAAIRDLVYGGAVDPDDL